MLPNETVRGGAKSKGEAEHVEEDAARGGVEDVGEHDVHGVLGAYGAGAQHGESELHGEYEVSGEKKESGVDGVSCVSELV